ncbi:ABC transporter [Nonomuraea sp. KM88]|uniref:ABC transporter n=1 Tax=Nonomuraea sp. KM88 TaxID=3457427 RepID=UPI003FCC2BB4
MRAAVAASLAGLLLLAGCGRQPQQSTAARAPHGYVAGAEEMPEPQSRLLLAGDRAGAVRVLDLLTGKVSPVADVEQVESVTGDGRFAYLTTATGGLRVIDTGAWTVDHGDHVHYYRAAPRDLGTLRGRPPYTIAGDAAVTAVRSSDGTVMLLDRARMEKGTLAETARFTAAAAVPYAEHVIVADGGEVRLVTRAGEPGQAIGACADAAGTAVTRRGVIIGCAGGAVLVTEDDGAFEIVRIPYPRVPSAGRRATEFRHRPGSTILAARAGDAGVWVLDVTARTWRRIRTGPAVAVNAAGDGMPVLVLTGDGTLRAYDPGSGKEQAGTMVLRTPLTGAPSIEVDAARAYVNDPAGRAVHEIDYNDGLRHARTFEPGFAPAHMTETGR